MKTPFVPWELIVVSQHQSSQVGGHFRTTTQNPYERSGLTDVRLFGPGPYTMHISNEPTRKRPLADGAPGPVRSQTSLMGSRVPMCTDCNALLNQRFEAPAKDLIRTLIPPDILHVWPCFTAEETSAVALWLFKVGLLLKH